MEKLRNLILKATLALTMVPPPGAFAGGESARHAQAIRAAPEGGTVESAPPLLLPQLIAEARQANPSLLEARKRWEAAQARVSQSTGLPAPKIGVEWEEIPRGSVKINEATVMYQLIQSLPFPGKLSARRQVAVKDAQVAAMAFKQAEWQVLSDLKDVYYALFLLDREMEIQQEQVSWMRQMAAAAEARYASGAGSQAELLQAQVEALEAANEVTALMQRREAMAAHLNHLLNRPFHMPIGQPTALTLSPLPMTPEELILVAEDRQPEFLAFKYSMERADAAYKLAKRELLPDLETMVELRDPAMGPIGPWDLSLALVLPFWFWTKARYGVKAALYDRASAEAAYQAMRNEIAKRIHEHWHGAFASYLTAKLCRDELIGMATQSAQAAMASYEGGRGSAMEALAALRMLGDRRRTYYQHLVEMERHVVMLEQSAGVPLQPDHATSDQ